MSKTSIFLNHNFQIACGLSLTIMMMVAAIAPAFPGIMQYFNIDEKSVGMLITAFSIPSFIFGPLGGIIADRLGRKRVMVTSLLSLAIFGGACSFAPNFLTLIILRILQGIGSAPMASIGVTIISDIFSGNDRARALGFNNTMMYIGYIIYPILGGALAGIAWNYPFLLFFLALPLAIIVLLYLKVPEPEVSQPLSIYLGATLKYLKSWKVIWLFAATIMTYILLYGALLVYFIILLSDKFGATPFITGLFVSLVGLCTAVTSTQQGRLSSKLSSRTIVMCAFLLYAISVAIVPIMPGMWLCLISPLLFGIAHGMNLPSLTLIASKVAPLENRAGFMALQTTMIPLGMTLAAPVVGLFNRTAGMDCAFYLTAAIALIIPVTAIFIPGREEDCSF